MLFYLKVIFIFAKTFVYYLDSVLHPEKLPHLKQAWAQEALRQFGYTLHEEGVRPSTTDQFVLVGNHISFLDIVVLMATNDRITFVAKKEVRLWPVIGIAAARVGTVFVDRSPQADRRKVRADMVHQIQEEKALLTVFPSGTTLLVEDQPWKKGAFEIAKDAGLQVKPFKISYFPLRESAFVDDDTLIGQMKKMFRLKNKKAYLKWLDPHSVDVPQNTAEIVKNLVAHA